MSSETEGARPRGYSTETARADLVIEDGKVVKCRDADIPEFLRKKPALPVDAKARKNAPVARGVLDYFPDALFEVAELSRIGNEQHNPGQPMYWAKHKSTDHADCIVRHLADRGTRDSDKVRHSTKVAWRGMAMLQIEIEAERAGMSVDAYLKSLEPK